MIENLKQYKRLFTFGCSFTEYHFPTWATIMHKSMPNATYYNLGKCGSNNPFIAHRIVEANKRFGFCKTDLVMVMYTTFNRECHYTNGSWTLPGNIYTQDIYNKDFVKKFADPEGYLIRDMATIELASSYLNNLPCHYIGMLSTPIDFDIESESHIAKEAKVLYNDLLTSFPENMFDLEMNGEWTTDLIYQPIWANKKQADYHPTPIRYCNYLRKIGIPITESAIDYATKSTTLVYTLEHGKQFTKHFPELHLHPDKNMW